MMLSAALALACAALVQAASAGVSRDISERIEVSVDAHMVESSSGCAQPGVKEGRIYP